MAASTPAQRLVFWPAIYEPPWGPEKARCNCGLLTRTIFVAGRSVLERAAAGRFLGGAQAARWRTAGPTRDGAAIRYRPDISMDDVRHQRKSANSCPRPASAACAITARWAWQKQQEGRTAGAYSPSAPMVARRCRRDGGRGGGCWEGCSAGDDGPTRPDMAPRSDKNIGVGSHSRD